ncbi:MAG: pectin-derived oligosaccharide transport system permease protein [Actinomycetota bacterium]|nr:pectin-derived oligosaccharide transport system permease protein [Actinomycetota bacterium]
MPATPAVPEASRPLLSPVVRVRRRRRREGEQGGEGLVAAFFLAPWFVGLFLITAGPIAASAYLSLTDFALIDAPEWIGLDNYREMWGDPRFWAALKATTLYVVVSVPLQLAFALALAVVLDRGLRGLWIYRSVFYLPSLLGGSVAIAVLWRQMFGTYGLVNRLLGLLGWDSPPGWVSTPEYALWTLVLLHVWTFGSPMVIFLAGLRQIPRMYYEAASVDGAGRVRRFFWITLPLLTPIIFFNLVLQVINSFQSFTQAFVISGGTGGPVDSTLFYTLYLYQRGFGELEMGYASAMAWVLLLVVGLVTGLNFLASRWWVFYGDE